MTDKPKTGVWMGAAFLAGLGMAAVALSLRGAGSKGTIIGLQLTARCSYGFFWLAYTSAPLATLFGASFRPLARRSREFGLSFASAHLAHVGLVAWLYYISARPPVGTFSAVYFGVALLLTYLLALFSIPALATKLSPRAWWALRTFGMEYIALAFLRDFLNDPFVRSIPHLLAYLPFIVFALAGTLIRLAAYVVRWRQRYGGSRLATGDAGNRWVRARAKLR